ncbi:crossover junction endodeoxyribonuclease RuvC [Ilyobacter polytropus]|uniref:Crossover junction endodeoxyribonuclease RuvC n=1 Tax=Ilyobacter polytropus (strain ATCC 51220 / DSM 2926 / LMG 16218 / CuHBu1) TaxID=572544 RepID=E3HB97_ILYPC|nr:crossover junction endodeoxyribonuclease RuvC [Ilyobacter polytropus]ADO82248.1 crossover junction endodeoxyribonuclease RuvC [Ilyobacter polytropus DSM 2926]
MRVLGIDPGTATVGYGIVDFKNNNYDTVTYGCIYTDKDLPMSKRLEKIYDELYALIEEYKPAHMAVEELFYFKNNKTVISVGQARGVIILCGEKQGLCLDSYTPLQVKMGITGYGKSEKKQVQIMVQKILKLNELPEPDDAADALAIAVTHINSLNSGCYSISDNKKICGKKIGSGKLTAKEYRELYNIK